MLKLKNKGFTLLEVMLAVTILSAGLVLVLRSFVTSLRAIKSSHNFLVANLLLEEKVWQKQEESVRDGGVEIEQDLEEGEFEAPFDNFAYKISFDETQFEQDEWEELAPLYKSTFEVFWRQREQGHSVSCVTYLRSKD